MKILVIGGTRFIGRHFVEKALAHGHEITLFNRGKSSSDVVPNVEYIQGDRDIQADLDHLRGRTWDAVLDTCAYIPRHVTMVTETLKDAVKHFAFISTISVYADPVAENADENAPLHTLEDPTTEQVTGETYGGLKVLCEQAADAIMPGRVVHIRPGMVVGSYDPTDRFTYWVDRVAKGGEVLVPGVASRRVQFIHAADLGAFMLKLIEDGVTGIYNAVNPTTPITWGDWLDAAKRATGSDARFTWVSDEFLQVNNVTGGELPFWVPAEYAGILGVSNARAIEKGLTSQSTDDVVAETLAWSRSRPADHAWKAGLSAEREAELLAKWHAG